MKHHLLRTGWLCILCLCFLCSCTKSFNATAYTCAVLDTLYKGDYTQYADMTGLTTTEAAAYRNQWLTQITTDFIQRTGAGTPSEETQNRICDLFKKIFASVSFDVTPGQTNTSAVITFEPVKLIADNLPALQEYVDNFNAQNDSYSFSSLSPTEFNDTYLDGILNILESGLTSIQTDTAVTKTISFTKDDQGLYQMSAKDLYEIEDQIIVWPEVKK